jgi:hypothetical protein
MANTFTKIASVTVGSSGAASMDFTSIPATYTDLCLKISARTDGSNRTGLIVVNNDTTDANYTTKNLTGTGSAASSSGGNNRFTHWLNWSSDTASVFSNSEFYFTNYAGSTNKSFSVDSVEENNATAGYQYLVAGLWSNTAAINRLTVTAFSGSFVQYSTATLYGIKNS